MEMGTSSSKEGGHDSEYEVRLKSHPSSTSKDTWTPSEDNQGDLLVLLPNELLLHILQYVPPRHLVRVCKLVSKRWYLFFQEPEFWQLRMKQSGNYSPLLEELPPPQINWARLCITAVHETNLIQNFDSKGELSLTSWKIMYSGWDSCQISRTKIVNGKVVNERYEDGHYDSGSYGGGDGWTVESWFKPDDPREEQVLKENQGTLKNYATSYAWCCREQYITLCEYGLSSDIMDTLQPSIEISEWYAARWDCGSKYRLSVQLIGERGQVVDEYSFAERTEQWQGGELGWRKTQHTFKGYGRGVRYVRFLDGGKDTQFWAGHYGSKMAAAWVKIKFS